MPVSAPPLQAPGGAAPAAAPPQDPLAYFNSLIGNLPPNSASLISLEPQLAAQGIKVMRNASGIAGKIQLPSGEVVDVGLGFSSGNPGAMKWQTLRNDERFNPGQGGGAAGGLGGMLAGGQGSLGLLGSAATGGGSLSRLAADALTTSPGFQFRLQEGAKALERSAAAKGTLLTGGTLKGLTRYAQDYAANEYGQNYNRLFNEDVTNYGRLFGEQGARYQQLYGLSGLGLNAAGQQAGVGSSYTGQLGNLASNQANQGTNLITQQGNVNANSTIGQTDAANQGRSTITDAAMNAYLLWLQQQRGTPPIGQPIPVPTVPR